KSFAASVIGDPTCYLALGDQSSNNCSIDTKSSSNETVITTKSLNGAAPHQTLIAKVNFKATTFTAASRDFNKLLLIAGPLLLAAAFVAAGRLLKRRS
ncbi:hypothetical protein KW792_01250, partial [Candidatus Saccharibacteria bacterium]|nr:hypothetical protein [Candidatus Saccharibacteria bacterium]